MHRNPHTTLITADAPVTATTHGGRAKCLQRLVRLDLPVPDTVALSFDAVHKIAAGEMPDIEAVLSQFPDDALLCVRPSSEDPDWGGPGAVMNIGMNDARYDSLKKTMGAAAASALYVRFVQAYAIHVARLDPDMFDDVTSDGPDELADTPARLRGRNRRAFSARQRRTAGRCAAIHGARLEWDFRAPVAAGQGRAGRCRTGSGGATDDLWRRAGECGSGVLQLVNTTTVCPRSPGAI